MAYIFTSTEYEIASPRFIGFRNRDDGAAFLFNLEVVRGFYSV